MSKWRIEIPEVGIPAVIEKDGVDIANEITGITIRAHTNAATTVTVDYIKAEVEGEVEGREE